MYKAQLTQTPQLSQKTSITPRLQQALKVLNMPLQELTHFIHQQFEQNPFLELEEENELTTPAEELDPAPEWSEPEADLDQEDTSVDIDWETAFEDRVSLSERANSKQIDADETPPDTVYECSLYDYLMEQLDLIPSNIITSNTERAIAEYILGNLNEDGQLELKLFQIPSEFLKPLKAEELSPELHTTIRKGLKTATGNKKLKFSKTATISRKNITHTAPETEGVSIIKGAWKINDLDNGKTYTIKYEQPPYSCKPALNFYQLTLEDIAESVGCETALVESVLREIQDNFEPLGIAHRDIREALLIQIRNQKPENIPEMAENSAKVGDQNFLNENLSVQIVAQEIIENHFDAFLNQKWDYLAEVLKIDIAVIDTVIKWIGTLSPYPGRYFTDPTVQFLKGTSRMDRVTPDVEVQFLNGKCQVVSVDRYLPRVHINRQYYENLMRNKQETLDAETKEWIEKRYRDALDLIESLAQRGSTIERVTKAIFEVQTDFLTEGDKSIKPLTLKAIAEQVDRHESTVSRVTSEKHVQTPHGTYPLRFFFSNKLKTTQGEEISAKQAKNLILEMINAETPTKPLSDEAISNALKVKGVILARRTVQKYRDELGIPTSRERSAAHASTRAN